MNEWARNESKAILESGNPHFCLIAPADGKSCMLFSSDLRASIHGVKSSQPSICSCMASTNVAGPCSRLWLFNSTSLAYNTVQKGILVGDICLWSAYVLLIDLPSNRSSNSALPVGSLESLHSLHILMQVLPVFISSPYEGFCVSHWQP